MRCTGQMESRAGVVNVEAPDSKPKAPGVTYTAFYLLKGHFTTHLMVVPNTYMKVFRQQNFATKNEVSEHLVTE